MSKLHILNHPTLAELLQTFFQQKVKDTLERKKTQRKDQLVQDTFASLDEFEEKQQGVTVPTGTVMADFRYLPALSWLTSGTYRHCHG